MAVVPRLHISLPPIHTVTNFHSWANSSSVSEDTMLRVKVSAWRANGRTGSSGGRPAGRPGRAVSAADRPPRYDFGGRERGSPVRACRGPLRPRWRHRRSPGWRCRNRGRSPSRPGCSCWRAAPGVQFSTRAADRARQMPTSDQRPGDRRAGTHTRRKFGRVSAASSPPIDHETPRNSACDPNNTSARGMRARSAAPARAAAGGVATAHVRA